MFKVSEDLDSDDDFLEKEFTGDFLSTPTVLPKVPTTNSTPDLYVAGSSKSFRVKSPSFEPVRALPKKSCNGSTILPAVTGSTNGFKPNASAGGFKTKSKISTVSPSAADTRCNLEKSSIDISPMHHLNSSTSDVGILHENGYVGSTETANSEVPISSHNHPFDASNVETRNSAFLAEWNDDSFFYVPQQKPSLPSPGIHNISNDVVTRRVNKAVRQRRFPGPAGLLPPRQGNTSLIAPEEFLNELKCEENEPTYQETEILSQSSGSVFEGGAWSAMLEDLGAQGHPLLKSMNIASINALGRNVRSVKIPFLSVLVQSIDPSLPDASVVFKDPTGEMHGVIHRDVWDQFNSDIAVGTVLVLRNVGIISAGVSSRKHVVNVTGNNLTAIYSPKDELNIQLRRIHEFAAGTSSKLMAEWEKSRTASLTTPVARRPQLPPRCSPLFNGCQGGNYLGSPAAFSGSPNSLSSNQRSYGGRPTAPNFNSTKRLGSRPIAPNLNSTNRSEAPSCNSCVTPVDPSFSPSSSTTAPNNRPTDRGLNPSSMALISTSSPFSPMPSRQSHFTNQTLCASNNENSSLVGNHQKPFTMKTPTSRTPHAPPRCPPYPTSFHHPLPTRPLPPILPSKKPKLSQNVTTSTSAASKVNPFHVDADTSTIDSLLEGIDADSLFGDF